MAVLVLAMNRYPLIFLNPLSLESSTVPGQRGLIYLAHVLAELPKRMNRDIDDLLPWNWKPG
jgi:hypothetical protein